MTHYDVVIVGGRCAGASLALRLTGFDVLLVDRATFPSLPNVPSGPFIHAGTVQLLRELGLEPGDYTHPGAHIERMIVAIDPYFESEIPLGPEETMYGIDRKHFDTVLWGRASQAVTARSGVAVTAIRTGDSMTVELRLPDGAAQTVSADLVVGADGRFSFTARAVGADIIEAHNDYTSTGYVAEWTDVADHSPQHPHAVSAYRRDGGPLALVIPTAARTTLIGLAWPTTAERNAPVETSYLDGIHCFPALSRRLEGAQRSSDVLGIKPIRNGYRQAYGAGWALVGDAAYFSDPYDGQGIYEALNGSRRLSEAILAWKLNGSRWGEVGAAYQQHIYEGTHTRLKQTLAQIKQQLYTPPPPIVHKTLTRYMTSDPAFQERFMRYHRRDLPAEDFMTPGLIIGTVLRGILGDVLG